MPRSSGGRSHERLRGRAVLRGRSCAPRLPPRWRRRRSRRRSPRRASRHVGPQVASAAPGPRPASRSRSRSVPASAGELVAVTPRRPGRRAARPRRRAGRQRHRSRPSVDPSSRSPPPGTVVRRSGRRHARTAREGSRRRSPPAPWRPTRRVRARSGARSETFARREPLHQGDRGTPRHRGSQPELGAHARGPVRSRRARSRCAPGRGALPGTGSSRRCSRRGGGGLVPGRPSSSTTLRNRASWSLVVAASSSLRAKWVHSPSSRSPRARRRRGTRAASSGGHTPTRCIPVSIFTWTPTAGPRGGVVQPVQAARV